MALGRLENWKEVEENDEIIYYKKLLRRSPTQYAFLDFLADALYKEAEYEEAIHCWKKFLQKAVINNKTQFYLKIAQAYENLGEIEQAFYYYGNALENSFENLEILGKYGQMAYLLENYDIAFKSFKKLCAKEPYNEIAWHNLALTYYNLGYHDRAIKCLKVSIAIDSECADSWYILASIYSENYFIDEALIALECALNLDNNLKNNVSKDKSFDSLTNLTTFRLLLENC